MKKQVIFQTRSLTNFVPAEEPVGFGVGKKKPARRSKPILREKNKAAVSTLAVVASVSVMALGVLYAFFSDFIGEMFSATVATPVVTVDFDCTKTVQPYTAPMTGRYQLETWGADGGAAVNSIYNSKGGYATGVVDLTAGETVYVYVGCKGENSNVGNYVNAGGWNGGGAAKNSTSTADGSIRGGGGGATDMRVAADSLYNRIIVAGGGGGNSGHNTNQVAGNGGGVAGANGSFGNGGTQTAGGSSQSSGSIAAGFGVGASNTSSTVGGGGGGWYGGGNGNGAGGGSGYVLTSTSTKPSGYFNQNANYYLSDPINVQFGQTDFIANPALNGDGFARVTPLNVPPAEFNCTESVQTYTVPSTGLYKIDTWGAQGGSGGYNSFSSAYSTGGKGGYSSGKVNLAAGAQLYVYVGCQGEGWDPPNQITTSSIVKNGGFGGGGNSTPYGIGGGGGASDVRIGTDSLYTRVIVAGGGGGGGNSQSTTVLSDGGPGGGSIATTLPISTQFSNRAPGGGATQSSGGIGSTAAGSFGVGASGSQNLAGGGGGGWYGGGKGGNSTGGGGGSGYVLDSSSYKPSGYLLGSPYYMTDTSTFGGDEPMPAPSGGTQTGQSGDGFVRITKIAALPPEITLVGDDPLTTLQGLPFNDPGATATDPIDGDLTGSITVSLGGLNINVLGSYTVTYSVTNSANLTASVGRTVIVEPRIKEFNCTQAVQNYKVPATGTYRLETWGAQGGGTYGGKGGYATGKVDLAVGQTVYVYVGCSGDNGGWNGGGSGANPMGGTTYYGGGGSDVRIDDQSLYARVIVAGGGGGMGSSGGTGGYGGGSAGGNGSGGAGAGNASAGGNGYCSTASMGSFGLGGNHTACATAGGGAGGGGWYGGGADYSNYGGGGGSGYVLNSSSYKPTGYLLGSQYYLSNESMTSGNVSMPATGGGTQTGQSGNGFVRITKLSAPPTITVLGDNPQTISQTSNPYPDPGATASDDIDGDLTSSIVSSAAGVDASMPGTYVVTYSVTDSDGQTATATRTVIVQAVAIENFGCTQGVQTFTAPVNGLYTLETWGAQGGAGSHADGGKGGYSSGKVSLTQGTTLFIYVGCQGVSSTAAAPAGGWNGGGVGQNKSGYTHGGGGGASDIRVGTDSLLARAIVAGGGGGAGGASNVSYSMVGGYGGGLIGMTGDTQSGRIGGGGGTQTAGGAAGCYSSGSTGDACGAAGIFGVGGNGAGNYTGNAFVGGGGGGGWYGGGGGGAGGPSGGGGSGYVLTSSSIKPSGYLLSSAHYLTETSIASGNAEMPTTSGGTQFGQAGDGYARITYALVVIEEFGYTGAVQTYEIPATGSYQLEVWGAQGGSRASSGTYVGGNGGYSIGTVNLVANDILNIYVGGSNSLSNTGGFNGGKPSVGSHGSGGGASDIRINSTSLYARVIVAGGGGGSSQWSSGGVGGGSEGGRASNQTSGAATQIGSLGFGADPSAPTGGSSGGGGGGGWYCGASSAQTPSNNRGGGGGSGWVYTASTFSVWQTGNPTDAAGWSLNSAYYLTSTQLIDGAGTMPDPAGGTMIGRVGNGFVRITKL